MGDFMKYSHRKAVAVFYKIVKLEKNGVLMIIHIYAKVSNTLKTELTSQQTYVTRAQAKSAIFEYVEVFYNKIRRHSTIDYCSPSDYEKKFY